MPIVCLLIFGTFLLIIQTTIFQILPVWMEKPDLLFIMIVFLAIHLKIYHGALLALLFGLIMDVFSGIFLGIYPVVYLLLFFFLKGISKHLIINESNHQPPLVALSYLLTNLGVFMFATILAPQSQLEWSWRKILPQMLILSVISIPFFRLYVWITTKIGKKPAGESFKMAKN